MTPTNQDRLCADRKEREMTFEEWYTTKYEGHDSGLLMTYSAAKQAWEAALAPRADGLKAVPVEPTREMLIAARDWSHKKYGQPIGNDAAIGCWLAMIEAAPRADAGTAGANDLEALLTDVSAIDTWHRGSPSYEHDANWFKDRVIRLLEERIAAGASNERADAEKDADPRILAEAWHTNFVNKCGYPPDSEDGYAAGYRAAMSSIADAEKDAERYRYLRNEAWGLDKRGRKDVHVCQFGPGVMLSAVTELAEEALDEAIDAAILAAIKNKENNP